MLSIKIVKRMGFVSQLSQLCPHECAMEGIWWQQQTPLQMYRCSSNIQRNKVLEMSGVGCSHSALRGSITAKRQNAGGEAGPQQGSLEAKAAAAVQSSSVLTAVMVTDSMENPVALSNSALGQIHFSFSAKWLCQGPTTVWKEVLSELENTDIYLHNFTKSMLIYSLEKFYTYQKSMFLTGLLFMPFCLYVCIYQLSDINILLLTILFLNENKPARSAGCGIPEWSWKTGLNISQIFGR